MTAPMDCTHEKVVTFRTEDGQPVMWACSDCKLKFVPFSQMLTEVAEEREACAVIVSPCCKDCAKEIRARGEA